MQLIKQFYDIYFFTLLSNYYTKFNFVEVILCF